MEQASGGTEHQFVDVVAFGEVVGCSVGHERKIIFQKHRVLANAFSDVALYVRKEIV